MSGSACDLCRQPPISHTPLLLKLHSPGWTSAMMLRMRMKVMMMLFQLFKRKGNTLLKCEFIPLRVGKL